jgi:hypothetical protein
MCEKLFYLYPKFEKKTFMPAKHPVLISKNNSRRPSEAVIQYPESVIRLSYAGAPGAKSGTPAQELLMITFIYSMIRRNINQIVLFNK